MGPMGLLTGVQVHGVATDHPSPGLWGGLGDHL